MIKSPPEFQYLVDCFHQDSLEGVADEQQWIATAVEFLSASQKQVTRKFLDDVLAGDISDAELRLIWESADPDFLIPDEKELRGFLRLVRDKL